MPELVARTSDHKRGRRRKPRRGPGLGRHRRPPVPGLRRRYGPTLLAVASSASSMGSSMTYVALPLLLIEDSSSTVAVGVAVAALAGGQLLAGLPAGALIDRAGSGRMAIGAQLLTAALLLVLAVLSPGTLPLWLLMALVGLLGAAGAPRGTAVKTLVPEVAQAARTRLTRANSLLVGMRQFAMLVGPLLAGLLTAAAGARSALVADACLNLAGAGVLFALRVIPAIRDEGGEADGAAPDTGPDNGPAPDPDPGRRPNLARELLEGVSVLLRDPVLRVLVVLLAVLTALDSGLTGVVLVAYVRQVLESPALLGVLITAFAGGSLIGTALSAALAPRLPVRTLLVGSSVLLGLFLAVPGLWPHPWVAVVALACAGAVSAPIDPVVLSQMQERVPPALRGRVLSSAETVVGLCYLLGVGAATALVDVLGAVPALLLAAALAAAAGGVVALVRGLRQPSDAGLEASHDMSS
ncbi:hypothetical protein GCM10023080_070200 [Streptomyces pseudoechinosporeus]